MRKLFYILNLTWGLPMTLIGAVAALCLLMVGNRPTLHGKCLCFTAGKGWGGVSLGMVMIVSDGATDDTKNHELGHAVQNAVYGVFMPFIVCIPSATRYWYRTILERLGKADNLPPYDSAWFEGQATEWGNKFIKEEINHG